MLVWKYLLLTCVSVWALPEVNKEDKHTDEKPSPEMRDGRDVMMKQKPRDCGSKPMAGIAQKAAAEAKAAQQEQNAAACKAAHMAKIHLAQKALQAAKAAEAALAGKQAAVEQLQQEVKSAQCVVNQNTAAVHQQQDTVNTAQEAAAQAAALHKLLCQATQLACQLEKTARCVLAKTKAGLEEKCRDLADARARLARLQHKLQCACADCAATKQAAHCACEAARAACGNARKKKSLSNETSLITEEKTTIKP